MARNKRGQNREQQQHRKNIASRSDLMDGRKFEEDYFTTTTPVVVENASHDADHQYGIIQDTNCLLYTSDAADE